MPVAVKDVVTTKGLPTTAGSRILEGWVPPYDATLVQRLRAAGSVLLGKTNMDEFAMGSSTEHSAYGPTRNPWDLDRIPGGSGGGSAAAVCAFEAPLAIGTDTGGSIRQPAAVTGTVGVKPTYGGVSRYGLIALASSLDQAGPCTRSVLDAALLHEVIGGHDPMDSTSIDAPVPAVVQAARAASDPGAALAGVRVGVIREPERRRVPAGRAQPLRRGGGPAGRGRRRGRRGLVQQLRPRPRGVLPDPAERGEQQPRQVRRHAVRPAGGARGRGRPDRGAGHGRHPRGRFRRRGEAPDHPGHVRAVQRVLRRLLRPGAEGAHAHRPRLRGRVRAGRRAGLADGAHHRLPARREGSTTRSRCTSTTWRPSRRTSPGCRACRCRPASPTRTVCRSACSLLAPATADDRLYRVGGALEALLEQRWGGPLLDRAPALTGRIPA
nr:amidase family protein [Angustibacter aerolatus]